MELVFIFPVSLIEMFWLHFFKVMEIVRAFRVYALMQDKELPVFLWDKSIPAVGTAKFYGRKAVILLRELRVTDFAGKLSFGAVVLVKIGFWSLTAGTGTVIGDITFGPPADGTDLLFITFFKVRDEIFISPVLTEIGDQGKFVNFELLVLWRMGIVKGPLLKWNISADKVN